MTVPTEVGLHTHFYSATKSKNFILDESLDNSILINLYENNYKELIN